MRTVSLRVNPRHALAAIAMVSLAVLLLLMVATAAQGAFRLDYTPTAAHEDGISIARVTAQADDVGYKGRSASVRVVAAPEDSVIPDGVWDCIARHESGKQPLGCAPHCGRLQWLPSTWRSAGGTKYAALPQNATWEQEKAVARSWLAKTSWGQWPNTSRACGVR